MKKRDFLWSFFVFCKIKNIEFAKKNQTIYQIFKQIYFQKETNRIMEFTNFKTMVRDELIKRTGEKCNVRINEVMKNNGVVLSGITMMQDDSNISPTIYLNPYYEAYESGEITLGCIVENVLKTYEKNKMKRSVDMRFFMNYESVKGRIILS